MTNGTKKTSHCQENSLALFNEFRIHVAEPSRAKVFVEI